MIKENKDNKNNFKFSPLGRILFVLGILIILYQVTIPPVTSKIDIYNRNKSLEETVITNTIFYDDKSNANIEEFAYKVNEKDGSLVPNVKNK